jgi:hypothetical protein
VGVIGSSANGEAEDPMVCKRQAKSVVRREDGRAGRYMV